MVMIFEDIKHFFSTIPPGIASTFFVDATLAKGRGAQFAEADDGV